jgi:acyl-coenzyme A thioesterase 13
MSEVPAGFEPSRRTSPFLDMIGPVYTSTGERGILLGLRARTEHLNTRGFVHGAILAALLDVVCGRNCGALTEHPSLVTVSLTVDYVAAAREGDWLEASATVTRVGRRLAFADGRVDADGKPVAKASAVFAVGLARNGGGPRSRPGPGRAAGPDAGAVQPARMQGRAAGPEEDR